MTPSHTPKKPATASILDQIGNTPLVPIKRLNPLKKVTIYAKLEAFNPGGSVKDRVALNMIETAEAAGELTPDKIVLEATSGNTGIGLAMVCAVKGYKCQLIMPESASIERRKIMEALGAEILLTPGKRGTDGAIEQAYALARQYPDRYFLTDQFNNEANWRTHYKTTGPEIWEQTGGRVDGVICSVGSGGTLGGLALALQPKGVKVALADPEGAALYSYYTTGTLKSEGSSITEGIGQGRITANLEGIRPDMAYRIPDSEALPVVFDLLAGEGLCVGGSSGINVAGAIRMAREMGPGHRIVTILCDYGTRYQSKLFNPGFLHAKGLPVPGWMDRPGRVLPDMFSA